MKNSKKGLVFACCTAMMACLSCDVNASEMRGSAQTLLDAATNIRSVDEVFNQRETRPVPKDTVQCQFNKKSVPGVIQNEPEEEEAANLNFYTNQYRRLSQRNLKLEQQLAGLKLELASLGGEYTSNKTQLNAYIEENARLDEQNKTFKEKFNNLQNEANSKIRKLKKDATKLKTYVDSLKSEKDGETQKNVVLQQQANNLQQRLAIHESLATQLGAQVNALSEKNNKATAEITNLQKENVAATQTIAELEKKVQDLQGKVSDLENSRRNNIQNDMPRGYELSENSSGSESNAPTNVAQQSSLQSIDFGGSNNNVEELLTSAGGDFGVSSDSVLPIKNKKKKDHKKSQTDNVPDASDAQVQVQYQSEMMKLIDKAVEHTLVESNETIAQLTKENQGLKSAIDQAVADAKAASEKTIEKLTQENDDLKSAAEKSEGEINRLRGKLRKSKEEVKAANSTVAELMEDNASLKKQVSELERRLKDNKDFVEEEEVQLSESNASLSDAENQSTHRRSSNIRSNDDDQKADDHDESAVESQENENHNESEGQHRNPANNTSIQIILKDENENESSIIEDQSNANDATESRGDSENSRHDTEDHHESDSGVKNENSLAPKQDQFEVSESESNAQNEPVKPNDESANNEKKVSARSMADANTDNPKHSIKIDLKDESADDSEVQETVAALNRINDKDSGAANDYRGVICTYKGDLHGYSEFLSGLIDEFKDNQNKTVLNQVLNEEFDNVQKNLNQSA